MKNFLEKIGDGIVVAFAIIFSLLFLFTAIEKLVVSGEFAMAIANFCLFILITVYVLKKVLRKN